MRFNDYLTEAGDTSSATNMELTIVQTWNGEPLKYPELGDAAVRIVDFLKKINLFRTDGKAEHLGSGSFGITPDWKMYGGSDGTPKTDLIVNGKRISLKKMGKSQLMSGARGETSATFHTVANDVMSNDGELITLMESYLNKMVTYTKSNLSITAQKETGDTAIDFVEAEKVHKQFSSFLKKTFDDKIEFRNGVVKEAMTGHFKFGKGIPIADYLLVFGADGNNNKFHQTTDETYISTIADKTKIDVSWKSSGRKAKTESGKQYTFFSVLRLAQNHVANEMKKYDGCMLTEGVISDIWSKFKNWFAGLWKKVKNWLMKSFDNVMTFLELDADVKMGTVAL